MRSPEQHAQRPPVRWWRVVCVLGLLAGLFGMHGLAPGGGLPVHSAGHQPASAASSAPMAAGAAHGGVPHGGAAHSAETHAGCPQGDGSCGGGHLQHADAMCASGAVNDGPVLPAPVPDPVPVGGCEGTVRVRAVDAPDGARAPPSLAELQLLRI
ncbi:DUF6153 family protein [Streptomyces sp. M1013]|uniref:DUF6153 family protein n=1 Tax=Streptomyces sp. M1013 TaxID=549798 RepID=UPI00209B5BAF|nr:DUF6153 family protein [Streptomyces sp. M1013]